MNGVEFLIGDERTRNTPLPVYSDEAVTFAADVSARLMKLREIRTYPDIAALAFWSRRANIERMKIDCPETGARLGRGLCFHITPGNIPVNFAFSYLFGVLAGCANIVRLPSRDFPQMRMILDVIRETLKAHPEIEKRTAFVRYPADDDISAQFSESADARMIWGGDRTIAGIRSLPTRPRCVDICFADRYSVCIINGNAVLDAGSEELRRLGEGFYNDTYLMDQNACSSPQLILWGNDSDEARDRFWDVVYAAAEKYPLQASVSMDKYVHLCRDAVDRSEGIGKVTRRTNRLYRVELTSLAEDIDHYRGQGGYFYEYSLNNNEELCAIVTEKYQTLTYFGFEPKTLREIVIGNRLRGIDRIVPIGRAMDIGVIWDGFDLIRSLSRIVNAVY
ncbi:MAG: hypothetical protein K5841_01105 [Fretibacterium sp.]|nr:hypothetical protein [Fretibacterium sp.]